MSVRLAYGSSCSNERQYWIMIVGFPNACSAPRKPGSGAAFSSLIMRGIAMATGHHLCTRNQLFTRMPMTKTQKSPSTTAVMRCLMIGM